MVEMSAVVSEHRTDDLIRKGKTESDTPSTRAFKLAVELGKLCFESGLDPRYAKDCIDHAYREAKHHPPQD